MIQNHASQAVLRIRIWIRIQIRIQIRTDPAFILVGWIRIRIDKKCWIQFRIRIRFETNADPQHCSQV